MFNRAAKFVTSEMGNKVNEYFIGENEMAL